VGGVILIHVSIVEPIQMQIDVQVQKQQ